MWEKIKETWGKAVSFVKDLASAVGGRIKSEWNNFSTGLKMFLGAAVVFDVGLLIFAGVTGGMMFAVDVFAAMVVGGCIGWCVGMSFYHLINWMEDRRELLNG
jgi:hypothetical protein